MCALYDKLVSNPVPLYGARKGKVGEAFVFLQTEEMRMVRERKCNSKRFLFLVPAIFGREHGVTGAEAIHRRITQRIKLWREGKIRELVEDTVATAARGWGLGGGVEDNNAFAWPL